MILDAFSLQGKVAVVSGCDTGLGQGMALGLAEAGCDIVGINIVEPVETIERVTALGRRFLSLTADLRQIDGIPQLLERAVAEVEVEAAGRRAAPFHGHGGWPPAASGRDLPPASRRPPCPIPPNCITVSNNPPISKSPAA